jgi:transketolase
MVTGISSASEARSNRIEEIGGLARLAQQIRVDALKMVHQSGASHIGSSFSMAELLAALYGRVLQVDPARPDWPERDRFILSKGHGCAGLYAALAARGFFPRDWLTAFYTDGGRLPGHATYGIPGVEVSTGSLGHGLAIATGMALAGRREVHSFRAFALLSDGECDEGSTWEAAMFAGHHRLDNLVAIIDYNKIQSLGSVAEVLELEPLGAKWRSFGWTVREIDGHDLVQVVDALDKIPTARTRPTCVIAHTIKGKGVSFMEGKVLWHYRSPDAEEYRRALSELGMAR